MAPDSDNPTVDTFMTAGRMATIHVTVVPTGLIPGVAVRVGAAWRVEGGVEERWRDFSVDAIVDAPGVRKVLLADLTEYVDEIITQLVGKHGMGDQS